METKLLKVGIWIPLERDVYWQGEGISRTIEFIIKGMIDEGLVGSDISLTLYTTHWVEDSLQKSFLETLGENYEKVQFKYITKPKSSHLLNSFFKVIGDIFHAKPILLSESIDFFNKKKFSKKVIRKYYSGADSINYGKPIVWSHTVRLPESEFFLTKLLFSMRIKRFCKKYKTTLETLKRNRKQIRSSDNKDKEMRKLYRYSNRYLCFLFLKKYIDRVSLGRWILNRIVGRTEQKNFIKNVQKYANKLNKEVDVWWTPSPIVKAAELLYKPNLVNFYDFFVGEYGYYWDKAQVTEIYYRLALVLRRSTEVITQSRFNKYNRIVHPIWNCT